MKEEMTKGKGVGRLGNQRGAALILALVMIAIMSLLGVLALDTTDTELELTANLRASQESFLAADRAVEYAMTNPDIYTTIQEGSENLERDNFPSGLPEHMLNIEGGTPYSLFLGDVNEVRFINNRPPPVGSGTDPTKFQARYYFVSVTGEGPKNTATRIESQISRIVPKPN